MLYFYILLSFMLFKNLFFRSVILCWNRISRIWVSAAQSEYFLHKRKCVPSYSPQTEIQLALRGKNPFASLKEFVGENNYFLCLEDPAKCCVGTGWF